MKYMVKDINKEDSFYYLRGEICNHLVGNFEELPPAVNGWKSGALTTTKTFSLDGVELPVGHVFFFFAVKLEEVKK